MKSQTKEGSFLFPDYSMYNDDGQKEINMLNIFYVFPLILI